MHLSWWASAICTRNFKKSYSIVLLIQEPLLSWGLGEGVDLWQRGVIVCLRAPICSGWLDLELGEPRGGLHRGAAYGGAGARLTAPGGPREASPVVPMLKAAVRQQTVLSCDVAQVRPSRTTGLVHRTRRRAHRQPPPPPTHTHTYETGIYAVGVGG